jgi:hypothetical protein
MQVGDGMIQITAYTSQRLVRDCGNAIQQNCCLQGVPGGKVNIPGSHSIGHSKQKRVHMHVFYSERFPR